MNTVLRAGAAVAIMLLAVPTSVNAVTSRLQPAPYRVEELAAGVFAVLRTGSNGAADANVLVIVNEEDVLVVDTNIFPSSARQVIAEIRKRTTKPVRYVINTHGHSDHVFGNSEYARAFPGVEFVSHPATRRMVLTSEIPSLRRNRDSAYPAYLARIESAITTGIRSDGSAVTQEGRTQLEASARLYRFFLDDVKGLELIPASMMVADSLVLVRGERTIVVRWLGHGNTDGDLVVHLPNERIVATGDLVVAPMPFGIGSFPRRWPATLKALKALEATTVVPGHGAVMRDYTYVDRLIALIEDVDRQIRRIVDSGGDLEAVRRGVDVSAHRILFTNGDTRLHGSFDSNFTRPILESGYREAVELKRSGSQPR